MPGLPFRQHVLPAFFILLVTGGLLAMWIVPGIGPADLLLHRWQQQLAEMPQEQVLGRLHQMAELGDRGLDAVVVQLGSKRATVADAAHAVLEETLVRWQTLPPADAADRVDRLTATLANSMTQFSPRGRQAAADLARKILLWPHEGSGDRALVIEHCERILRDAAAERIHALRRQQAARSDFSGRLASVSTDDPAAAGLPESARTEADGLHRLSASDLVALPQELLQAPTTPRFRLGDEATVSGAASGKAEAEARSVVAPTETATTTPASRMTFTDDTPPPGELPRQLPNYRLTDAEQSDDLSSQLPTDEPPVNPLPPMHSDESALERRADEPGAPRPRRPLRRGGEGTEASLRDRSAPVVKQRLAPPLDAEPDDEEGDGATQAVVSRSTDVPQLAASPADDRLTERDDAASHAASHAPSSASSSSGSLDKVQVGNERAGQAAEIAGSQASASSRLATLGDGVVMRYLSSSNPRLVDEAAAELRSRGFQDLHLELARRLADPDPAVRQKLAEQLPQINQLDARPWLLWLSHDEDADVRRAALNIMATSRDAMLLDRVRQAGESDDTVR